MSVSPYIVSVGEALVDFVATNPGSLETARAFLARLGGEGANVAVGLAKYGARSSFVGRVGGDAFGRFLIRELKRYHVDTSHVVVDEKHRTRLAFVSRTVLGERDFAFWESAPAASCLRWSDIALGPVTRARMVNIAPLLLVREPSRFTALRLARDLRTRGIPIAFDANMRLALWRTPDEARRVTRQMISRSTIVRLNEAEARFLTGIAEQHRAAATLRSWGPQVAVITMGKRGCFVQTSRIEGTWPGFALKALDTTGCGDAFFAALIYGIAVRDEPLDAISLDGWDTICRTANAAGALTALKPGAADAIPSAREIKSLAHSRTRRSRS